MDPKLQQQLQNELEQQNQMLLKFAQAYNLTIEDSEYTVVNDICIQTINVTKEVEDPNNKGEKIKVIVHNVSNQVKPEEIEKQLLQRQQQIKEAVAKEESYIKNELEKINKVMPKKKDKKK